VRELTLFLAKLLPSVHTDYQEKLEQNEQKMRAREDALFTRETRDFAEAPGLVVSVPKANPEGLTVDLRFDPQTFTPGKVEENSVELPTGIEEANLIKDYRLLRLLILKD
jgi:hypothetical protein